MEKSFKFTEYSKKKILIDNDSDNGGKSQGSFEIFNNKVLVKCQTKNTNNTFAYCGINIRVSEVVEQGIDFNDYDSLEFNLNYNASLDDTVLVYLSNLEKTSSNAIKRANMYAYLPQIGKQAVTLKLNDFTVPSWWLLLQKNFIETSLTNFDNIVELRIVTGDNTNERSVNFSVSDIVFKGKWLKADTLYLSLLIIWLLVISYNSLTSFSDIRRAYSYKTKESKALQNLNKLLATERNKFENLAKKDPLTHCYNREGLNAIMQNEIDLFVEDNQPCSIILLDIDHFKEVNDQFGHNEGDRVLVNIANVIHGNIKAKDTLARWGGEEFLVICSNTSIENALLVAESLRKLIENTKLSKKTRITSSFGVTQINSNDFEENFKQVDKALYKAKSLGRNNVQSS